MGARPFRKTDNTPILLLANGSALGARVGSLPPAAPASVRSPTAVDQGIAPLTQEDQEIAKFYAANNGAHTPKTQNNAAVVPTGDASPSTRLVEDPLRWFLDYYNYKEEHKRIQHATLPQALDKSTEAIDNQVNGERALLPLNMRGIVREEAHKINNTKDRKIASLCSQLKNLKTKIKDDPRGASKKHARANTNKNKRKKRRARTTSPATTRSIFAKAVATPPGKALQPSIVEEAPCKVSLPQMTMEAPPNPALAANLLERSAPLELEGATKTTRVGEGEEQSWVYPQSLFLKTPKFTMRSGRCITIYIF